MGGTKYLDPAFAQRLWQQWEVFSETTRPLLEALNQETSDFLSNGLQGDFTNRLKSKRIAIFEGLNGFIDHIQIQSNSMKEKLIYAADEICDLDLLLSQSYKK